MPTAPDLDDVKAYLGSGHSWGDDEIQSALDAETVAQAKGVRLPADPADPAPPLAYPADLANALCRRVAVNLAMRSLPLGVQATSSDGGVAVMRVGGGDREVNRLEAPYRKLTVA